MRPSPLHPESPLFLIILSALMAFTSLSTDIYLPALPAMEAALHGDAELTITGFVAGFALGQLFWGPVADRTGRKLPLYIGIVLFVIGSVGCAMADSMQTLVLWRFFQALGACVGPMLSRTMIRDLYGPQEAAQMLSTLVMAMAVAPIVGPMLGGLLLKVSGWEANFWLLTGIGTSCSSRSAACPKPCRQKGARVAHWARHSWDTGRCCTTGPSCAIRCA